MTSPRLVAAIVCAAVLGLPGCGKRNEPVANTNEPLIAGALLLRGELTYPAEVDLPQDAWMLVELRGSSPPGSVLAQRYSDVDIAQPSIPFRLAIEHSLLRGEEPYQFQGAIFSQGLPIWLTREVPVELGEESLDLGGVALQRFDPVLRETLWQCDGHRVAVDFADNLARLRIGEEVYPLRLVPSASGTRYEAIDDAATFVWDKGEAMTVSVLGVGYPDCTRLDGGRLGPGPASD
ncbi:MAG TPA: MliC family protein [Steroidobacteraceae bacterium]|nr:MliC family protein [Steroidobacteraceae bacterium]